MFDGENKTAGKTITTSNQIAIIDFSRQVKVPLELVELDDWTREALQRPNDQHDLIQ
jgi:hypothetical protein